MQPLTKKAKKAITDYAMLKCKGLHIADLLIHYTLEADRMPREKLYVWLEKKGYVWDSRGGYWRMKKNTVKGSKQNG